ncbi:hypothetical protein ACI48D_22195 [Massilia sp. LXY-6]|uniref:hypothetical protein n=1 Tax=Massilia sp. LXY-6 TaxID=3379823 RepID=UPI003EE371D4
MRTITLLSTLAIGSLFAHLHAEPLPLTGHFVGSGRACYGTLEIARESISWNTAFSRCKAHPFRLVEDEQAGAKRRLTFEFSGTASACRFGVISLTHDEHSGEDTGWEATGYADLASYQADKRSGYTSNAPDMMSCALVRAPAPDGKRQTR